MRRGLALVILLGCKPGESGPDERLPVLSSLSEKFALHFYTEFAARSVTLETTTAALCADPSQANLDAARDAWWGAMEPWKDAEIIQFGPVIEYPERLGPKLDDWPVNAAAVEELIAQTDPLDFSRMGSATRGLPVVEYLLYADDAVIALADTPRRCEVLAGAAADVRANADLLVTTWTDGWLDRMRAEFDDPEDNYETVQHLIDEWANRMGFTVENIRLEKLGKPLGDDAGGEPQPDTIESRPSGRSIENAKNALRGVRLVWTGDAAGDNPGIIDLVPDETELIARIDALFDEAEARLDAIPSGPLEDTILSDRNVVAAAQEPLQMLQVAFQADLAQPLNVTIAFNDNDGD